MATTTKCGLRVCISVLGCLTAWGCSSDAAVPGGTSTGDSSGTGDLTDSGDSGSHSDCEDGDEVSLAGRAYCVESDVVSGFPFGEWCGSAVLADLDGDGRTDLIAQSESGDAAGFGEGNTLADWSEIAGLGSPSATIVADWNEDPGAELLSVSGSEIRVFTTHATRTFEWTTLVAGLGDQPDALAVGDVDGDGERDVITARRNGGRLEVATLLAATGFSLPATPGLEVDAAGVGPLYTHDFDRDGAVDLLLGEAPEARVRVAFGDGAGTFSDVAEVGRGRQFNVSFDSSAAVSRVDLVSRWLLSAVEGFSWQRTEIRAGEREVVDMGTVPLPPLREFSPGETHLQHQGNLWGVDGGVWIAALQWGTVGEPVLEAGVYAASSDGVSQTRLWSKDVGEPYADCDIGTWAAPARVDDPDGTWWLIVSGDEASRAYLRLIPL